MAIKIEKEKAVELKKEELLWKRYLDKPDSALRALLVEHYRELVRTITAVLYAKRPDDTIEFDDYFQFGMVGLMEALERYRIDKGVTFETFASYRIRGSILNGLEKMTELRDQSAYKAKLKKERLESLSENKENDSGLFEQMVEITLGLAIGFMLEDTVLVERAGSTSGKAYQSRELSQLKQLLVIAVEKLPERERIIIQYHYFQQMNFDSLADILEVSKGRVSQLHKRALEMIREQLGGGLNDYY